MAARHYSPQLDRLLVCALYHEAKLQRKPMTHVANQIVTAALEGTTAMIIARTRFPDPSTARGKQAA